MHTQVIILNKKQLKKKRKKRQQQQTPVLKSNKHGFFLNFANGELVPKKQILEELLAFIERKETVSTSEIASFFQEEKGWFFARKSIVYLLKGLLKKGVLDRTVELMDARHKLFYLKEKHKEKIVAVIKK